jgi:hypothetical protein
MEENRMRLSLKHKKSTSQGFDSRKLLDCDMTK